MKKTIYRLSVVAAALAAVLLTAQCAKEIDPAAESKSQDSIGDGIEVTLTATKGEDTRAELTDATTKVSVTWSAGDKIYVVGETDGLRGYLTLSSGAESSSATFKGCIKYLTVKQNVRFYYAGKGKEITDDTFDLSIATQGGTLDGIESMHVMCGTLSNVSPSTLNFGTVTMSNMIAIGKFDIINCTGFDYTSSAKLTCAVSSATLDLKTGTWTNQAEGDITLNSNLTENYFVALIPSDSEQTLTFSQNNKKTPESLAAKVITAGKEYMSTGLDGELDNAIEIGIYKYIDDNDEFWGYGRIIGNLVWAPVNCGCTSDLTYGLLYQWGRRVGTSYGTSWTLPKSHSAEANPQTSSDLNKGTYTTSSPDANSFYYNPAEATNDWYTSSADSQFSSWPMTAPSSTSGIGNPCPTGWRVPEYDELNALRGGNTSTALTVVDSQNGLYLNGSDACSSSTYGPKLFLSTAGFRNQAGGTFHGRGSLGFYWTSSVSGVKAQNFYFNPSDASSAMTSDERADGGSVRCIYDNSDQGVEIDGTIWATYNLGTDADHPYGLLYQWGRVYGQGCYDETYSPNEANPTFSTTQASSYDDGNSSANSNVFYKVGNDVKWHKGTWSEVWATTSIADASNPCPDGWTLPTKDQLENLKKHYKVGSKDGLNGVYFSGTQTYSESVPNIFVPFAGKRDYNGKMTYRGKKAETSDGGSIFLWACGCKSSANNSLKFESRIDGTISFGYVHPNQGLSIRCVKE